MNELTIVKDIKIENMIYEIRVVQVMLDSDLARLYECKNGTKEINQAVKNNPEKFPERFSWKLTKEEHQNLRSKFLTTNFSTMSRATPRAFTEQGVSMFSTILKSKIATQVSINIMDVFVAMRKYISSNLIEQKYINTMVLEDHNRINMLESSFQKFEENKKINEIYFNGGILTHIIRYKKYLIMLKKN